MLEGKSRRRVSHAPQQSEALKVVPPHSRGFCPASFGGSFFVRIKLWFSSFFYLTLVNKPWRQGARFFLYQQNVLVTANPLHLYMARQRRVLTWFCLDWQCREREKAIPGAQIHDFLETETVTSKGCIPNRAAEGVLWVFLIYLTAKPARLAQTTFVLT